MSRPLCHAHGLQREPRIHQYGARDAVLPFKIVSPIQ